MKPKFTFWTKGGVRILSVRLPPRGAATPQEWRLAIAKITSRLHGRTSLIIDEEGLPAGVVGALTMRAYSAPWVAAGDPRQGAVVIAVSYDTDHRVGDIIPFPE